MAIQFRCPQCDKLLQTPDGSAGRQVRCPKCGAVVTVPGETQPAAGPPESEQPSPFAAPGGPSAAEPNPYASPTAPTMAAPTPGVPGEIRPARIDLGDVFGRAWEIFKQQWGLCLGAYVLVWAISFVAGLILGLIPIVGPIVNVIFSLWLTAGMLLFFLKIARGQPAQLGELFAGGPYLLSLIGVTFLLYLATAVIVGVCVGLPVVVGLAISEEAAAMLGFAGGAIAFGGLVYLGLVFCMTYFVIVDRNPGAIQALGLSAQITRGNRFTLLAIGLLAFLIQLGGLLALCVGVFVTTSYLMLLGPVIYLAMSGQPTAGATSTLYEQPVPQSPFGAAQ